MNAYSPTDNAHADNDLTLLLEEVNRMLREIDAELDAVSEKNGQLLQ